MFFITESNIVFYNLILFKVNYSYGWLLISFHEINSNILFLILYLHIIKNLLFNLNTFNNRWKWISGLILYLLFILICFLGYILPWGQMSFWAATVISNLLSILPYGMQIINLIWGGQIINNNTLIRFTTLHFILPFILLILIIIHLKLIHNEITTKKSYTKSINSILYFRLNYYIIKDNSLILTFIILIILFFVCYSPEFFSNPTNSLEANSMVTPKHILPEWYFLWLYGILKILPNKIVGIFAIIIILLFLFMLPFLNINNKTYSFKFNILIYIIIILIFLILTDIGLNPITNTILNFVFILIIIKLLFKFFLILIYCDIMLIKIYNIDIKLKIITLIKNTFLFKPFKNFYKEGKTNWFYLWFNIYYNNIIYNIIYNFFKYSISNSNND